MCRTSTVPAWGVQTTTNGTPLQSISQCKKGILMSPAIHHTVIVVKDLDASLRFYRDGIGLEVLSDRQVQGEWPWLFGAPSKSVRAVFLGESQVPDDSAGVLELNVFDGEVQPGAQSTATTTGFFLMSFFVDVDATLDRLSELNLGGLPKRVDQPGPTGPIGIATVHDPDGLTILLTPGSITRTP
jgi:catechol 2,3-dioxygenase-like lactoylglutathione lyase family enzyme